MIKLFVLYIHVTRLYVGLYGLIQGVMMQTIVPNLLYDFWRGRAEYHLFVLVYINVAKCHMLRDPMCGCAGRAGGADRGSAVHQGRARAP